MLKKCSSPRTYGTTSFSSVNAIAFSPFSPLPPQGWLDCKLRFVREKRERREMGLNLFSLPPLSTYVPSPLTGENLMAERENSFCVFLQSVIPFFAYYNTVRPCFCFLLLRGLAFLSLSLSLSLSPLPPPPLLFVPPSLHGPSVSLRGEKEEATMRSNTFSSSFPWRIREHCERGFNMGFQTF